MLLQEFWDDRYVGYCERLREVTRVGYESAWRCHVEPVFGSMELADIGVDDIELWLSGFAGPGAARKAWAVLRQMLRKAAKWGYLEVDVTRLEIDLPAKPLYVPRLLTIGQTRRQLQGFYGHALEAWLIVDSCLALRPEEGYGVDWADIDMRSGITHIQRGVQWVAGHEVVVPPKTELSDRFLPLPRFAVRRLREIRNGRKGRIIGDLTPSQAARRYASWCKKESLPYVPVQNLRHSWATNALEAGVNIAVVSKFLGHTDIKTTARFYLRPEIASLKEAQSIWERALIGQSGLPSPTAHVRPIRRVHWEFQRERHLRHLLPISQRQGAWRNCRHPRAVALGRHARLGHNHLGEWCGLGTNAIDEHPYWRVRHKMACKILMGCDMELAFPIQGRLFVPCSDPANRVVPSVNP